MQYKFYINRCFSVLLKEYGPPKKSEQIQYKHIFFKVFNIYLVGSKNMDCVKDSTAFTHTCYKHDHAYVCVYVQT